MTNQGQRIDGSSVSYNEEFDDVHMPVLSREMKWRHSKLCFGANECFVCQQYAGDIVMAVLGCKMQCRLPVLHTHAYISALPPSAVGKLVSVPTQRLVDFNYWTQQHANC